MAGENKSMRPSTIKLLTTMGIIIALTFCIGCGPDSDILDEVDYRFNISSVVVQDQGNPTDDIDVWDSDLRAPPDNCPTDEEEKLTETSMSLEFESKASTAEPGFVYRVEVDFDLLQAETGFTVTPALVDKAYDTWIIIPEGGGSNTLSLNLLSTADKGNYRSLLGGYVGPNIDLGASFQVSVTAFVTYTATDIQEHQTIFQRFTITLDDFDTCKATSGS